MSRHFRKWISTYTGAATFVIAVGTVVIAVGTVLQIPSFGREIYQISLDLYEVAFQKKASQPIQVDPPVQAPPLSSVKVEPLPPLYSAPSPLSPPPVAWPNLAANQSVPPPAKPGTKTANRVNAPRQALKPKKPHDYGWYLERLPFQGDWPNVEWYDQWRRCGPGHMLMPCYYRPSERKNLPQYNTR